MSDRRPVLLTVSGAIPPDLDEQVSAGRRPRADYVVMRDAFDADLVDVPAALAATGRFGRIVHRLLGVGSLLAWFCFRHRGRYDVIVTDGEQVGIPLAVLCRVGGRGRARHMMIVHILSTRSKERIMRWARLGSLIDRYVVYCSWQQAFITTRFGVPADRVVLSTFMVDTDFFDVAAVDVEPASMICAVGLERRDYPTLMRAVAGLDVRVVVAAASPWSTQSDSTAGQDLPANVEVRRLNLFELRELYAASRFVVMPLVEVDFQAGITAILESMSMSRAVVCTRTAGQTDTIEDGVTGVYVPPGDVDALRSAITRLLDDEPLSAELGARAREWAVGHADVERYAHALTQVVQTLRSAP
ncbi:MAG: glycosyltransferase family 4 protein [Ilumatobacteraceae bacterium]